MSRFPERHESLWWLSLSPTIWLVHFLAVYMTVAVYCAKSGAPEQGLLWTRWAILAYSLIAATGVIATGIHGYRRHRVQEEPVPHDFDTAADRHRFIGFATVLLSGLSLVGIVFVTLPALFIDTCR